MIRAYRRSAAVAVVALGALATTAVLSPAHADEEFVSGSGQVTTRIVKVGPTAGRLSFAPSVGLASAQYTGTVGRAESKLADFAAIESSAPKQLVEQTPSVRVDTGDDGADKGVSKSFAGLPADSPIKAGGITQTARAGEEPSSDAGFILGDFQPIPGVLEMSGAKATSHSGVVGGVTREAIGHVEIGHLGLGGQVSLDGLTWDVRQRTGKAKEVTGTFGIKGITLAGKQLAPPSTPEQLAQLFTQLNGALKPLGIRLDPPTAGNQGGVASITPLGIHLEASVVGKTVGPPILAGVQPLRDPIQEQLTKANPQIAALLTLGDVAAGAVTGRGGIDLQLGGGQAYTEGERFANPFGSFELGAGGAGPVSLGGGSDFGGPALGGATDPGAAAGGKDAATDATKDGGKVELADARREQGSTGGAAAVVGLIGLLAVLSMAGADWWRLRHEPRRILS